MHSNSSPTNLAASGCRTFWSPPARASGQEDLADRQTPFCYSCNLQSDFTQLLRKCSPRHRRAARQASMSSCRRKAWMRARLLAPSRRTAADASCRDFGWGSFPLRYEPCVLGVSVEAEVSTSLEELHPHLCARSAVASLTELKPDNASLYSYRD